MASGIASQVVARLLIQTGAGLDELTTADLDELAAACRARQDRTGRGWRHYRGTIHAARQMLFHLGVLDTPAVPRVAAGALEQRMAGVAEPLRGAFVAYLHRKSATCKPKTCQQPRDPAGRFRPVPRRDRPEPRLPGRAGPAPPHRTVPHLADQRHQQCHRRADHRRRPGSDACTRSANFLAEITEWGWDDAPPRRLMFRSDLPRLPRPLPRYLPVDADRRLAQELAGSPYRLAADALLLQRACGLRIGELLDLELDCVHDIPGQGSWLKVPLGKLDSERMVPLDEESLTLLDRIVATRSPGRPIRHPRTGRPAQFLFTHHGRRLSQNALRAELNRAAAKAGIGHVFPHQLAPHLRHRAGQRRSVTASTDGPARALCG